MTLIFQNILFNISLLGQAHGSGRAASYLSCMHPKNCKLDSGILLAIKSHKKRHIFFVEGETLRTRVSDVYYVTYKLYSGRSVSWLHYKKIFTTVPYLLILLCATMVTVLHARKSCLQRIQEYWGDHNHTKRILLFYINGSASCNLIRDGQIYRSNPYGFYLRWFGVMWSLWQGSVMSITVAVFTNWI